MKQPADIEAILHDLVARQQIQDALMRAARGIDRLDRELILSAYHPGARDSHGSFEGTAEDFADWVVQRHTGTVSVCNHLLGNILIRVEGDVAHCESYVLALHRVTADGVPHDLFAMGRYVDRFELRDGAWRIADRYVVFDKDRLDPVGRMWEGPLTQDLERGVRDRSDPSYRYLP